MRALAAALLSFACRAAAPPSNVQAPDAGIAIAIYSDGADGYAVVDDRRWVDVAGRTLLLPNIDPDAELASLVIEPLGARSDALRVGACSRERIPDEPARDPLEAYTAQQRERRAKQAAEPSPREPDRNLPVVRCAVAAPRGRYLVRLVYITKALGYRAHHDVDMRDEARATIASRFAIVTPVWQVRAEVVLHDGVPGGVRAPREVARARVLLDGSTSVLGAATREVSAQLRRIYEGAVITSTESSDVMWAHDSVQAIWVWLELEDVRLAPGPIRVHLEVPGEGVRDLDVPATSRREEDAPDAVLRVPLWVDESLRGSRQRVVELSDGASLVERYNFGIANSGEHDRVVFVDEPLREATRRRLDRAWPHKPTVAGDRLRTRLDVKRGRIERTGYTLTYDF